MKRNIVIFGVVLVVVAALLVSTRMKRSSSVGLTGGTNVQGKAAPDFELKDLNGKTVKLSDYRGKAVLLNFWATWCPPCKAEMPWFVDMQKRYGNDGLQILGVSMDDGSPEEVAKFAQEIGVNYPIVMGKEDVAQKYGSVDFLPTSFFIDRNGNIVDRVFGIVDRKEIEEKAKKAMSTAAQAGGVQ